MKMMQKKKLQYINEYKWGQSNIKSINNSQIFLMLINYCPFSELYSGTSRFMEASEALISRCSIAFVRMLISFWRTSDSGRGSSEE
jgi:hypothetical protein